MARGANASQRAFKWGAFMNEAQYAQLVNAIVLLMLAVINMVTLMIHRKIVSMKRLSEQRKVLAEQANDKLDEAVSNTRVLMDANDKKWAELNAPTPPTGD